MLFGCGSGGWDDVDELAEVQVAIEALNLLGCELHNPGGYGIESVVVADADVLAWMPLCAALADDNVTDFGDLAAENFDT